MSKEDEPNARRSIDKPVHLNRRNFVKALGATGAVGFSGVGSAQTESEVKVEREVDEVSDSTRDKYASMALSDPDVRQIIKNLKQEGWEPEVSDAIVYQIDKANRDSDLDFSQYYVVSLPFTKQGVSQQDTESAGVLWTDKSLAAVGFESPVAWKVEESVTKESELTTQDVDNSQPVATEYSISDGSTHEESYVVDYDTMDANADGVSAQGCFCRVKTVKCDNIPWYCWVSLAASYAGTYWACGACGLGGVLACGKCLVAIGGSGAGTVGCLSNHDCWTKTVCRSRSQVKQKPCKICNNIHHPNC